MIGCQSQISDDSKSDVKETESEEIVEDTSEEQIVERKEITSLLTNSQIYNMNVYLSDLSNTGFKSYNKQNIEHDSLLNLGFWLFVFEGMDKVDYEEFVEKLNLYFDFQLEKKGNDQWLFLDNKFYHPSLPTGYDINKVTQVDRIFDNGDGTFLAEVSIYRFESNMEESRYEQYLQSKSTWTTSMLSELLGIWRS